MRRDSCSKFAELYVSFGEYNVLSLARVPGVGEIEILWNVINSNPPCTRYHGQVEENYR